MRMVLKICGLERPCSVSAAVDRSLLRKPEDLSCKQRFCSGERTVQLFNFGEQNGSALHANGRTLNPVQFCARRYNRAAIASCD